jgi:hypothetical protein
MLNALMRRIRDLADKKNKTDFYFTLLKKEFLAWHY